jgi:hypothetical protein
MKIAEGLHRIGSDIVNSYLVVDGSGGRSSTRGCPATGSCWTTSSRSSG